MSAQNQTSADHRVKNALLMLESVESGLVNRANTPEVRAMRLMIIGLRAILTSTSDAETTARLNHLFHTLEV